MPTGEQRALWSAIRSHLDDDTPRLVYADWLQEHGDEARAEFIRLQCQVERLPDDRKTQRKVRPGLEYRERVLSVANRERWVEPIFRALTRQGSDADVKSWARGVGFRRGFVFGLRLDLDGIHRVMTAGTDLEPLDNLVVAQGWEKYNPKKLAEVFGWEGLGCVGHFTFRGATDNCVGTIATSTSARFTHLILAASQITDAGAIFLAEWPRSAGLVCLNLSTNRIGDRGAEALAGSPFLAGIAELNLQGNPIGQTTRRRLILRFGGNVILSSEP
jgi:uncharacterized protein (TIGR02996 family)